MFASIMPLSSVNLQPSRTVGVKRRVGYAFRSEGGEQPNSKRTRDGVTSESAPSSSSKSSLSWTLRPDKTPQDSSEDEEMADGRKATAKNDQQK